MPYLFIFQLCIKQRAKSRIGLVRDPRAENKGRKQIVDSIEQKWESMEILEILESREQTMESRE